ncbi:hypothetical protein J4471_01050 [Candidatus Woesearchaeota archaeon]|nr:hypothetical protein [Candidatus Woesearchaeota archaeon]
MSKLAVFLISGLSSVAIDLDHFIVLEQKGLPITLFNLNMFAGRPFHIPILIIIAIYLLYSLKSNS